MAEPILTPTVRLGNDLASFPMTADQVALFWSRISKTDPSGCWLWTGVLFKNGYGRFPLRPKRTVGSHRIAWMLVRGPIPRGLLVCHNCPEGDRRDCCNPDHLFLGDQNDNQDDCTRKGRRPKGLRPDRVARGERCGSAKLDERMVKAIRRAYADGCTQVQIANWFDLSQPSVSSIIRGTKWSHVVA